VFWAEMLVSATNDQYWTQGYFGKVDGIVLLAPLEKMASVWTEACRRATAITAIDMCDLNVYSERIRYTV